jgi:hypothetical protein
MTFAQIPAAAAIILDANTLVYHSVTLVRKRRPPLACGDRSWAHDSFLVPLTVEHHRV